MQLGTPFAIFTTQSPVPEAQGGTIANGTYVATSGKVWGSSATEGSKFGTAGSATMVVSGNDVQTITTGATSMKVTRRSGTFVIDATTKTISFTNTCTYPAADGGAGDLTDGPFTVEGTTLHFFVALNNNGVYLELTYQKQ